MSQSTRKLTLGVFQSHTLSTLALTLSALERTAKRAAALGISVLLFPEAYLGGYPRRCSFGSTVGNREDVGREQFRRYFNDAVDLGDTPQGAGDDWVKRRLPVGEDDEGHPVPRGDGTRERLEKIARDTGVFLIVGLVERAGGSLYCAAVYVEPARGILGKRRKVMPTGSERLVWAQGSASTLRAVTTTIKGVKLTMASAICWENYMPLLRQSLYSQNVNLYLAPTADGRDTWLALMRTVASEGRTFVLSANQCIKTKDLPDWIDAQDSRNVSTTLPSRSGRNSLSRLPSGLRPQGKRRKSVVTKTVDDHEITWPLVAREKDVNGSVPEEKEEEEGEEGEEKQEGEGEEGEGEGHQNGVEGEAMPRLIKTKSSAAASTAASISGAAASDEFASRGGSCIVGPMGQVVAGPLWDVGADDGREEGEDEEDALLYAEVDFDDCERGRLDFDAAGSYSRSDAFKLHVDGLDLSPPP